MNFNNVGPSSNQIQGASTLTNCINKRRREEIEPSSSSATQSQGSSSSKRAKGSDFSAEISSSEKGKEKENEVRGSYSDKLIECVSRINALDLDWEALKAETQFVHLIKAFRELGTMAQDLLKAARETETYCEGVLLKEIERKWSLETSQEWEKLLFEKNSADPGDKSTLEILNEFRFIAKDEQLRDGYLKQLKIIYDLFIRHCSIAEIAPYELKRIRNGASLFGDEVNFLIGEKEISIPRICLLNSQSPYFRLFWQDQENSPFEESSKNQPIPIQDIDEKNFILLKRWLEKPSEKIFRELSFDEILNFVYLTHKFEIPALLRHCEQVLDSYVDDSVNLLAAFGLMLKFHSKARHLNICFRDLERTLKANLKPKGLNFSSLNADKIHITIKDEFFKLEEIEGLSYFHEVNTSLNLTKLKKNLSWVKKMALTSIFPNTDEIKLCIKNINWAFLQNFRKLKNLIVEFWDFKEGWRQQLSVDLPLKSDRISFDIEDFVAVSNYSELSENFPEPPLSIDDYIQLLILTTAPSSFHEWPSAFKELIQDKHLQELVRANKIDLDAPILDLNHMPLVTLDLMEKIVSQMPKLEEASLLDPSLSSPLYNLIPKIGHRIKKLTLPLAILSTGLVITPFIEQKRLKKLSLFLHTHYPSNFPAWISYFQEQLIEVEVYSQLGVKMIISKNSIVIEPPLVFNSVFSNSLVNHKALLQNTLINLNLTGLKVLEEKHWSSIFEELSKAFHQVKEISFSSSSLNEIEGYSEIEKELLRFERLQRLDIVETTPFSERVLKALGSLNIDITIKWRDIDQSLEGFLQKAAYYRSHLPNYHAEVLLDTELKLRADITDEDLLKLKPEKSLMSSWDFSGMKKISSRGVLSYLKTLPSLKSINLNECTHLAKEIMGGKISVKDLILIEVKRPKYTRIFIDSKFSYYWKELKDKHIQKLMDAKKIEPHSRLNLSEVHQMSSFMFSQLIKEVKPQVLILTDALPRMMEMLPFQIPHLKYISISSKALEREDYFEKLLENCSKIDSEKDQKEIHINFELSELNLVSEVWGTLAYKYSREVTTKFVSPNVGRAGLVLSFSKGICFLTIYDCDLTHSLSKESETLTELSKFSQKIPTALDISYLSRLDPSKWNFLDFFAEGHLSARWITIFIDGLENGFCLEVLKRFNGLFGLFIRINQDFLTAESLMEKASFFDMEKVQFFSDTPIGIVFSHPSLACKNLKERIDKLKIFLKLIPNLDLLSDKSRSFVHEVTDNDLLELKPKDGTPILGDFSGMTQITDHGLLSYLDGLKFKCLHLRGCTKITSNGLDIIKERYPHVEIFP